MSTQFALDNVLAVGVDPHRESLDVVAIHFPEEIVLDEAFDNTQAGHRVLWSRAQALAAEHNLGLVFGLEDGSNYGYALGRYLVNQDGQVKEVNPRMTNRQRDFYGEDKTNRLDALATAAIVLRAYERLPDVTAVQEATQATQELSRYRQQLVKEQTANLNRLHRYLANQYPTYKTFFSELNGVTALHFWATYPTPAHLRATTPEELADFFHEKSKHRLGTDASLQKARHILNALADAPLSNLGLLAEAQGAIIRNLLQLKRSIESIEAELEETVPATGQQLETFQGIGIVTAAVLVGETRDTARYNGSAPVTKGTGKHTRQVENHWCNRRLKSTLSQLALTARHNEPLSAEYYQACLDRGLDPGEAHKRLMRRLSDIVFAMMRNKTPYDPAIHRRKQQLHKGKGKSAAPAVASD